MTHFRTIFWNYFCRNIHFEQVTDQNYLGFNRFFHAESESETGFSISHTVFAGLPYCHIPYFDLATLETLIGPYLGHHSSNFQISFCKINYFFHDESNSDSQMSISVTNFAGLPDSAFPPGNP